MKKLFKVNSFNCASLFILCILLISGCSDNSSDYDEDYYFNEEEVKYEDGEYCADVQYFNPNTGTTSNYTLNVEVEDNELIVIHWANGGWLDNNHFYPEELDEDGWCSFESDKGYQYEVQITGSPCSFTDAESAELDHKREVAYTTCPKCGEEKNKYDNNCYSCQDEIEHTCPNCGQYDSFIFSQGDLCSDCEDED